MRYLKASLLLISISFCSLQAKAYSQVPVQILLEKNAQSDTVGFNLVETLPELMYRYILAQKVTLYNSPAQEVKITPAGLISLEKSTGTSFSYPKRLVIMHYWSSNKKKTNFEILGFNFVGESYDGKLITYGFVNAHEVYQLLNSVLIPVNINGTYRCSYWDAVLSMKFNYELIQFGKKRYPEDAAELRQIKEQAFYTGKPVENQIHLPNRKQINYFILPDYNNEGYDSKYLFSGLSSFFMNNPEVFFNMGGYKFASYLNKALKLKVTSIEVNEVWEKYQGKLEYTPTEITIYINNKPLNKISINELSKYGLYINFKPIEQLLRDKKFDFFITQINNINIPLHNTDAYYKALRIYSWSQLTEAVKYY